MRALEIKPTDYGCADHARECLPLARAERQSRELCADRRSRKAEEELKLHPENANCACLGATVLAFLGEHDRALEWLARSLATDPGDLNIQYNAACTYALLGEADRAIDLLESWVPQVGAEMKLWFKNDSDLRCDPRPPALSQAVELSE